MMIKYHKFGLIRFRQCHVHIWLQHRWRRVHKRVFRAHSSHLRQHGIWVQVGEMWRYFRPVTLDLGWTQWSPHCVVLTFAFCHLLEQNCAWVKFVNTIEMSQNLTYVRKSSLTSSGACPIIKLFWSVGLQKGWWWKSIVFHALLRTNKATGLSLHWHRGIRLTRCRLHKRAMGSIKMFRKWTWWKGGQYEAMDMLRWGQHRAMDMMERGEGSIKMFRQSGHTTVIFSCSWLAIYCHTRQLFESLVSLKITFRLDKGLKWQAADVRTTSLWLNWLCR